MAENWITGALAGHSIGLDDRMRVRLRLARSSDALAIGDLLASRAIPTPDVQARRLVQFDPRRRYVVCATGLFDGSEELVGVGAIDLTEEEPEPDLLITAADVADAVAELLRDCLVGAARATTDSRAA